MKEKIKLDIRQAMINKDTVARDVLRVLMGEIERNEQTPKGKIQLSDNEVLRIIKKLSDNIKETIGSIAEIKVLSEYLPKELTRIQIEEIVDRYIVDNEIDSMKGMGRIMGHFGQNFPNRYDGKLVSTIIREVLS